MSIPTSAACECRPGVRVVAWLMWLGLVLGYAGVPATDAWAAAAGSQESQAAPGDLTSEPAGDPGAVLPTPHGYRIGPDDALAVKVLQAPELNATVRVTEDGAISLPLLGMVPAAGLTAGELELDIEARLRERYIREPEVSVQVTELQSQAVSVMGAVNKPGIFQVRGSRTLLEVLSLAGGFAETAGDSLVVLRRGTSIDVSLKTLLASDGQSNLRVEPGDVVNVQAAAIVYVVGAVKKPGAFAMRGNDQLTVLRALAMGEGLQPYAAKGDALVLRRVEGSDPVEMAVDLGALLKGRAPDVTLEPQDVLFVPVSGARAVTRVAIETMTRLFTFRAVF